MWSESIAIFDPYNAILGETVERVKGVEIDQFKEEKGEQG